jgi:hypothetical protein
MTPDQLDALDDEVFAAMVRLMHTEASEWERMNTGAGRR